MNRLSGKRIRGKWRLLILAGLALGCISLVGTAQEPPGLGDLPPLVPPPTPAPTVPAPMPPDSALPALDLPSSPAPPTTAPPTETPGTAPAPVEGPQLTPAQAEIVRTYQEGKKLMDEGRLIEAIAKFSAAIAAEPRFVPGYIERGRCLSSLREFDLAIRSFTKALNYGRRFQDAHVIYFERGLAHLELRNFREALDDFEQAIELNPVDARYLSRRGEALARLGEEGLANGDPTARSNYAAAIRSFDRAIELDPKLASAWYERGLADGEMGEVEEAIQNLKTAIELDPLNFTYSQRLGVAYLRMAERDAQNAPKQEDSAVAGTYQLSIDACTQAIELPIPTVDRERKEREADLADALALRALARLSMAEHSPESARGLLLRQAIDDCRQALGYNPRMVAAWFYTGNAHHLLGEEQPAIDAYTEALSLAPEYSEAKLRRGIAWFDLGEFDLALQDFDQVGHIQGDPRPYFWAGLVHARRGDYRLAVDSYSEALRNNRNYPQALSNRGLAHLHLGMYERAIEDFNRLLLLDRTNALAYYRRGVGQERLNRRDEAIRSYEQALRWDNSLSAAQQALDRVRSSSARAQ